MMVMQFQVPQNIDLEDKIIGPMTLKQFLYVLAGGMLDYVCFIVFDPSAFVILALPITAFFVAMAFAHVQETPFPKFLQNLIIFLFVPKARIWSKDNKPVRLISRKIQKPKEPALEPKTLPRGELDKIAQILDNRGWDKKDAKDKLANRVLSSDEAKPELNLETKKQDTR
jgi:hypothetical protein